jgi:hypothetical protein
VSSAEEFDPRKPCSECGDLRHVLVTDGLKINGKWVRHELCVPYWGKANR